MKYVGSLSVQNLEMRFLSLWLFSIVSILGLTSSSFSSNETDRLALIAFRDRISGDPLEVMSSWNGNTHFCNWKGVSCSTRHQGRVVSLNLTAMSLQGSIPPHIGNLSFLTYFQLQNNHFHGEISPEIGRLSRLRHLDLSMNEISGRIPSNLSHCSNLQFINFDYNNLVGKIPDELRILTTDKLQVFFLYVNNLTGSIPSWLANASSLVRISLAYNNFQGSIPIELGKLSKLELLQISSNNLTGSVPNSIYNMTSLLYLDVGVNQLHGSLPDAIGFTLPNLRGIYMPENQFTGHIPSSLTNISGLQIVSLAINSFSGIFPSTFGRLSQLWKLTVSYNKLRNEVRNGFSFFSSLTNCSNLQLLDLGGNNFRGQLPASIANFSTNLEWLTFGENEIYGPIPTGIENLTGLKRLALYTNNITGEIPESIGKLENLADLRLFSNRISGKIPSAFGNLTKLLRLHLEGNHLEGNIPHTLGNCQSLLLLSLEDNNLSGSIPKQVLSISSMSLLLNVSGNSLSGPLPAEIGNMTKLSQLDVSKNRLLGEIPNSLSKCLMLEQLYMDNNLFEGNIPSSLNALKSIQFLDLSSNKLSGQIPEYFKDLTLLQYLNLSFNDFEGEIPVDGIFRNPSLVSVAGNAKLCGGNETFGFPKCKNKEGKEVHIPKFVILIIVACIALVVAFVLFVFIRRRRRQRQPLTVSLIEEHFLKVSYAELRLATNEFSSSNFIGEGSHGYVYKGILSQNEMVVAVKVFNLKQRGASKSFMAECEALRNIRHRNLLKIITICSSIDYKGDEFKALVYNFMENGSLEQWLHPSRDNNIREGHLSFIERLSISIDVASAIEYLHHGCETTIIHGDIKPSNVLLDQDMIGHVGDFGLARFLSEIPQTHPSDSETTSTGVKGTFGYVPPEYGMGGKASMPGDVYSYGILLLELFTGRGPTDSLFNNGDTIHSFTASAIPNKVVEVIEPSLQSELENNNRRGEGRVPFMECLVAVLEIGIFCSNQSPRERMEISKVVTELCDIKQKFLGKH